MRRFSTFEAAALHVSWLRSEGFFAEAIHENAAHLYGAFPMMGTPVVCSQRPFDNESEQEPVSKLEYSVPTGFRFVWRMIRSLAALLLVLALVISLVLTATALGGILSALLGYLAAIPSNPYLLGLPLVVATILYLGYRAIILVKEPNSKLGKGICLFLTLVFFPI